MLRNIGQVLLILQCLIATLNAATTLTKVVSVISTTTVYATATDTHGACDDFTGACVVYGTSGAPYTTTIYAHRTPWGQSSTVVVTATTTILATSTVSNSAACDNFSGACVVYGSGQSTSTVYGASSTGNGEGYIGRKPHGGGGVINGAPGSRGSWMLAGVLVIVISAILL